MTLGRRDMCIKIRRFRDRFLSCEHRYRQYYLIYTILFLAVCAMVFSWYFVTGRTLIWQGDGWTQHYRALVYYAKYLRSIIRNIIYEHQLVVLQWDFSLGEGNDILQTLHYYVMGDPFAFFPCSSPRDSCTCIMTLWFCFVCIWPGLPFPVSVFIRKGWADVQSWQGR